MKETKIIAYRCPECAVALIHEINLFSLSKGEVSHRCSCGESVISLKYIKNRETVQINVPCIACPSSHPYQVAAKTFFGDDMFVLQCTDSGLDIFFAGERDEVIHSVEENTRELQKLFEFLEQEKDSVDLFYNREEGEEHEHGHECGCEECHDVSDNNKKHDEYEYYDAVVTSGMLYLLKELADADRINCPCGKKELILDVGYDVIEVSCDACQARAVMRAMTDEDIVTLAQRDTLELM